MRIVDFSAFQGALGRPLRWLIHRIPKTAVLPVLQGPLRGARWVSGASDAGCWLGSYDTATQDLLVRRVPRGGVVYDIGANVGFFTLLTSRLVGPAGSVYAFEPLPANLELLRRHLALNRSANVTVFAAAASDRDGHARFEGAGSTGRLSAEENGEAGDREVPTVRLDGLVARGELKPPAVVKLDVEGAELAVLQGMETLLATVRPILLVEFHGRWIGNVDVDTACRELLKRSGYELTRVGRTVLAEPRP
jgi:FkbM family methyltransferase